MQPPFIPSPTPCLLTHTNIHNCIIVNAHFHIFDTSMTNRLTIALIKVRVHNQESLIKTEKRWGKRKTAENRWWLKTRVTPNLRPRQNAEAGGKTILRLYLSSTVVKTEGQQLFLVVVAFLSLIMDVVVAFLSLIMDVVVASLSLSLSLSLLLLLSVRNVEKIIWRRETSISWVKLFIRPF